MTYYQRILSQFNKLGYYEETQLTERDINKAMDQIARVNAGYSEFDKQIAEEMWTHCKKENERTVLLRDYIGTLIQAESILREQYGVTEQEIKMENNSIRKRQLQEQFAQIQADHRFITAPFKLPPLRLVQTISDSNDRSFYNGSQRSQRHGDSIIFAYEHNNRESSSTDLKILLFITLFVLLWQFIVMFHKHHFLNLLVIFFVLSIFFLNYFDKNYVKFLLIALVVSVVFDLIWMIFNAGHYWSPEKESQHSNLHTGFLVFIVIMTVILMVLKLIMAAILIKYRNMDETLRKNVSLFGYKIKLDGRPTYNPFTPFLSGRKGNDY